METIEKLQSLYQQLDQQVAAGEDVVADIRKEINNLELSYLKQEVLPAIAHILGGKIKRLRCQLDCNLQFTVDGKIDYTFCTSNSTLMVRDSIDANSCSDSYIPQSDLNTRVCEPVQRIEKQEPITLRIVDYSEKAIAVYGNSRYLSDTFKSIGGCFNPRLKEGPGWVFSRKKREEIETLIAPYITKENSDCHYSNYHSTKSENEWLTALLNMKGMSKGNLKSPHKVIFLLTIIEFIQKGYLKDERIFPSMKLSDEFNKIWEKHIPSDWPFKPNVFHPFIHMAGEPFYSLIKVDGVKSFNINQSWYRNLVLKYVEFGVLDKQLFNLLKDERFANNLKDALISHYIVDTNSSTSIEANTSTNSLLIFSGYIEYLSTLISNTGRPYSASTIYTYATSLRSNYMREKSKNYCGVSNLEEITDISKLEQLLSFVTYDVENNMVNKTTMLALKMYCEYRKLRIFTKQETYIKNLDAGNNRKITNTDGKLFYIETIGCKATGQLINGNIVILKGSILRKEMTNSYQRKQFRVDLLSKYCSDTGYGYVVNNNLPAMAPSTASGLVQGRSSNGKTDWKDEDGRELGRYLL